MKKEKTYTISKWMLFAFLLLLALIVPSVAANAAQEGTLTIKKFRVEDYENLKDSTGHSSDIGDIPQGAQVIENVVYTLEKLIVSATDTELSISTPIDSNFPARTMTTDANGEAVFTNLPEGYYLITGSAPDGYTSAHDGKFIVRIPNIMIDAQGNETTHYDVVVYPKGQRVPSIDQGPDPNTPKPDESTGDQPRTDNPPGSGDGDAGTGTSGKGFAGGVKTGDLVRFTGIFLLVLASVGIIVVLIRRETKSSKKYTGN